MLIKEHEGNRKWQDAEELELKQLFEYDTFDDLGLGATLPDGYKKIPCHMVYDVKWDSCHKAVLSLEDTGQTLQSNPLTPRLYPYLVFGW